MISHYPETNENNSHNLIPIYEDVINKVRPETCTSTYTKTSR